MNDCTKSLSLNSSLAIVYNGHCGHNNILSLYAYPTFVIYFIPALKNPAKPAFGFKWFLELLVSSKA